MYGWNRLIVPKWVESRFFYGRDAEYDVFRSAVDSLRSGRVGGGTMSFQGAPGAGKFALMLECMEAVRLHSTPENPWVAVSINPNTLVSSVAVMARIVDAVNEENKRLSEVASDSIGKGLNKLLELGAGLFEELSSRGIAMAGISVGGKSKSGIDSEPLLLAEQVFSKVAPLLENVRVVVFVDEAQNTPVENSTKDVIYCLHNPPGKIPLVAAFFGLSDTKQVLSQCGLSRFADERVCDLEPLSIKEAAGSFRRMLDAYYIGTDEEKDVWANALAELSQGWPQHVNRVGVVAGRVLRTNEGRLERQLLEQALQRGEERKNAYYAGRVEAGSSRVWVYKQLALAAGKKEGAMADILSYDEIDLLSESAPLRKNESVDEFLTNALHAGLLAPAPDVLDHYKIPIPALGNYLRSLPVEPPQVV